MGPGEIARRKRYREMKILKDKTQINKLKEDGKYCGNCSHYEKGECTLKSDFYGIVKTDTNSICLNHKSFYEERL